MGEAGAEDAHAVAEGVFQGFQDSALFYANLDGILLAEQRQVQQALVQGAVQGRCEVHVLVPPVAGTVCSPKPLAVLVADVKVIARSADSHGIGGILHFSEARLDADNL